MIRIHGDNLTQEERKLLRRGVTFAMDKLVSRRARKNYSINVKVVDLSPEEQKQGFIAHVYETLGGLGKKFNIVIHTGLINKTAKKILSRMRKVLMALMHELVHVKQYLKDNMCEYSNGDTKFQGKLYKAYDEMNNDAYYDSPWEIEAYGREVGLWNRFKREENGRKK